MLALRETPFELLDREFRRFLGRPGAEMPDTLAPYAVDVHEDADHIFVEAELPGFTTKDIDITLEDGVLTLRAQRTEETKKPGEGRQPLHIERRWSRFERSFTLPTAVNESTVNATLTDGMLKVTLDKREEVKPKKIQIKAGDGKAGDGNRTVEAKPVEVNKQ